MSDHILPEGGTSESLALFGLINGYRVTQAIHVIAMLGIPDLLEDRPRKSDDLAAATGSDGAALYRVMRALVSVGIFHENHDREFALAPLGACLRSSVPGSLNAWAKFVARPAMWESWGALLHTVRTGENAFRHVHGKDTWSFRTDHVEEAAVFDAAMRENIAPIIGPLLAVYDFSRFRHIVDVGGGDGTLLAGILSRCPRAMGTLLDLPHVVAKAQGVFANAGVASRASIIAGTFFEHVPAGADAYLLKHVLHDWEDVDAIAILCSCRRAIGSNGKLVLVERLLRSNQDRDTAFSDLNMLVNAGGRERTCDEFAELLNSSAFKIASVLPLQGSHFSIEASPL
jgi:O-methyltransferase domain/Dimerisation domain